MSELWSNDFIDYYDGDSVLDSLLNPPEQTKRFIPPLGVVRSKPVDNTDTKLVSFLKGKKVYFTDEEIEQYIIE